MSEAVLPEHRPTAADLLRRAPRAARLGSAVVAAVAAVAVLWALVARSSPDETPVVVRGEPTFNFRHGPALHRAAVQGTELARVEQGRLASFAVSPLAVPAYRGDIVGLLPVLADAEIRALRTRHPGFELVEEGKTRLNGVPGYTIAYRVSRRPRSYGRLTLLPEPGTRRGARLDVMATPAAGVATAEDVGARGQTKLPYRSFRFGTEWP